MEKQTLIESKISLLLKIDSINGTDKSIESICQYLLKAKADIECFFITLNTEVSLLVKNNKSFIELNAKGKATLLNSNGPISNCYKEALLLATGVNSICIDTFNDLNLNNIINWVNANKRNIKANSIGYTSQVSKSSFGNKIYNASLHFFLPLQLSQTSVPVLIGKTEDLLNIFSTKVIVAKSHLSILYTANCNAVDIKDYSVSAFNKMHEKGILDAVFFLFKAIDIRFNYFVTASITELKTPNIKSLKNGNHPLYRLLFFLFVILATFVMPFFSADFGMTWDERQHNDYSQLSYKWFATMGEDSSAVAEPKGSSDFIRQAYRFYGEQINTVSSIVYNTFDLPQFETRHFINALYGLIGIIFCGLAVKQLVGWRGGILAIIFMVFNPGWFGNSMNNPTDIPFASSFAMSLYFFIKILKSMPKPSTSNLVWLGMAIGLGIASRVGAFLIVAYFGLFLGIQFLWLFKNKNNQPFKLIGKYFKVFIIVAILGYFLGILLWPYGLLSPFKNPFIAFAKASDNSFYTNNVEIFEGKRMYMLLQAPWYYVIKFLSIGNPIYLLLGSGLFIVLIKWIKDSIGIDMVLMLLFMVLFPIVYVEYSNINYYNGWRHYLFIVPSIVVLAAVAYDYLIGNKNIIIQYVSIFVLIGLFVKPTYWFIKNHPNQYVYFNEFVGGINGAYGNYETDYYSNSCREAGEWIAKQEPNKNLLVCINNEPLTASYYANKINPKIQFQWVREYEEQKPEWDYLILTTRTYSKNELLNGSFPPKGTVYTVMADDIPLAAVVKRQVNYMPAGYKAIDNKQFDSAVALFNQAVLWEPKSEEATRMYGFALMLNNKFDLAEKAFDKSIEIFPENYSAYANKGLLYFNLKEYQKCIDACFKATTYKNNITEAYYYAAMAYLNMNNYNGAIERLETALKFNGQSPEVFYYLGKSYEAVKNTTKAISNFEYCLGMNPKFKQAWGDLANQYRALGKSQQEIDYCMQQYNSLP